MELDMGHNSFDVELFYYDIELFYHDIELFYHDNELFYYDELVIFGQKRPKNRLKIKSENTRLLAICFLLGGLVTTKNSFLGVKKLA